MSASRGRQLRHLRRPLATPISVGKSNGSQLTTKYQYQGNTQGEEFFIQSYSAPTQDDMKITDAAGHTYQILACGPGSVPLQPAAVPEPATVIPFVLGALGLLTLATRARRAPRRLTYSRASNAAGGRGLVHGPRLSDSGRAGFRQT